MENTTENTLPQMENQNFGKMDVRPPNQWLLQEHKIEIEFMSRGCVISVGCKKIPFENVLTALNELREYITDPYKAKAHWVGILP